MERRRFSGFEIDDQDRVIVTTSRGHRLVCKPIATMLDGVKEEELARATAEVGIPPCPTYTVEGVSGDLQEFKYDQEGVDDPSTPEEDREAWVMYQKKLAEAEALADQRSNERLIRTIAISGVEDLDAEPDSEWVPRHEYLGWTILENPYERQFHYFRREVIGAEEDGYNLMAGIAAASGMNREVLAQLEDRFRRPLGEPDAEADPGEAVPEGEAEGAQGLDDRPPVHDDRSPGQDGDGGDLEEPELVG